MLREVFDDVNLWRNLPNRLIAHLPMWKIVFILFFAIDMAVANLSPDSLSSNPQSIVAPFVLFPASVVLLSRDFVRRIGSGLRLLHFARDTGQAPTRADRLYRVAHPVVRYVLFFILSLALFSALSQASDYLLPSFSAQQDVHVQNGDILTSLLTAALACVEEYWRWSMIVSVLLLGRWILRRRFDASARVRNTVFWIAVVISSLVFGSGHMLEFTTYRWWSIVVLGAMGFLLAMVAILTRRFLIAVALHYVYDFLALGNWFGDVALPIYFVALLTAVVVLPGFWLLLRRVRPRLNIAHARDLRAPEGTQK